ncbi:MAG: DedA family protein [Candidatus Moranbacteria bacterium]|nr:DedA family protein [Candidatus Moranbacteria bacterium]
MEYQQMLDIITFWGYPLMFLIMIAEGPVATLAGAFLASMGIFNIYIVLALSIIADTIGDVLFYSAGYFGGHPALKKAEKFFRVKQSLLEGLKERFKESGAKIIFTVKATTGLCSITFVLAGVVRMNFKKFLLYSTLGGIIWSTILSGLGYFFGFAAKEVDNYIQYAGWVVFASVAALIVFFFFSKKKQFKRNFENKN